MDKLREALVILLDETQSVAERLDQGLEMVPGMGKNVASAILLVTHPDRSGVWNNRSEANMKRLNPPHMKTLMDWLTESFQKIRYRRGI